MSIREHQYPLMFLALASLAVYSFSLGHEFIPILDDTAYLLSNQAAQGFTLGHLKSAFTNYFVGNYAPLHIISYMFDYTLWGMKSYGFVLTNIILHTLNGLLFYGLLTRSGCTRTISCAAAYIFLLHPVQVESVVWISQRKTVLAMFFFLLSFHSYLNYRSGETYRKAGLDYLLSLMWFSLALLSKSVAVILPAALLLHDSAFDVKGRPGRSFRDKGPYAVIAAIGGIVAYFSQAPSASGGRVEYHGGSPLATLYTMLPVLVKYLKLVFWPSGLSLRYDIAIRTAFDEEVAQACLLLLALVALGVYLFKHKRNLFSWYALFFVGLLPVSQIISIVTLMNDRYLYFPLLGLSPFVCILGAMLMNVGDRWRNAGLLISCAILITLPVLAFKRTQTWQTPLTVWQDVVQKNPGDRNSWLFLLDEHVRRGDLDSALADCQTLLTAWPQEQYALKMAGTLYTRKGDLLMGRAYLERAIRESPTEIETYHLLANNYLMTGEKEKAAGVYRAILALNPGSERALQGLSELGQ